MNGSRQVIVNGSAHNIPLPAGMIHTVCTSPPYYSLRSYAGQQEVDWPGVVYKLMPSQEYGLYGWPAVEIPPMRCALGLEPTPEAYIGHLVLCFREVKRVLREDGVAWVVMGDSYAAGGTGGAPSNKSTLSRHGADGRSPQLDALGKGQTRKPPPGLQQGDLMLIPHRLALALQADGWLVRNDVVWHKKAPMPESVSGWRWERCRVKVKAGPRSQQPKGDAGLGAHSEALKSHRPDLVSEYSPCPGCPKCSEHGGYVLRRGSWRHTRAHETVIMAVKSMGYFSDQERVREANKRNWNPETLGGSLSSSTNRNQQAGRNDGTRTHTPAPNPAGRNPRSVLTPKPSNYKGAHYAVFSPTLISPLLRATAPTRVCPVCGAPWCPVVERESVKRNRPNPTTAAHLTNLNSRRGCPNDLAGVNNATISHRHTCDCVGRYYVLGTEKVEPLDPIPGWCLDPFAGTGTTLAVCAELGVNAVGLDISPQYLDEHAKPRIGLTPSGALGTLPLFAEMEVP